MRNLTTWLGVLACALLLVACGKPDAPALPQLDAAGNLAAIQARGEIVIATRNAPTIRYIDRDGRSSGPENDFATAFARYLGVTPRFVEVDSTEALLKAVAAGQADMAAGSITRTKARQAQFTFGPEYARVWQEVVCDRRNKPRKIADLAQVDKLVVGAGTSYAARLAWLAKQQPALKLHWQTVEDTSTEELLGQVASGDIGCTLADSNIVKINRRYYPSLLVMFKVGEAQHLAWPMPKGSDKLRAAAFKWFEGFRKAGKLNAIKAQYYGFLGKWDFVDKQSLVQRINKVYPKYEPLFAEAAKQYDFDQWLLAAQAYQESHWNPEATSYTGVRGIMMLTMNTAEAMGVDDRLDAEQSIMAGAAYLRKLEQKLPDTVAVPDRYYFALAAYNIGYYHLRDAMTLAKRQGLNPNRWRDLQKTLPQLMQRRYYRTVPYGYARGSEAVSYVQRIRDYSDIIRRVVQSP